MKFYLKPYPGIRGMIMLILGILLILFVSRLVLIPHGLNADYFTVVDNEKNPVQQSIDRSLDEKFLESNRELFAKFRKPFRVYWSGFLCIPRSEKLIFSMSSSGNTTIYLDGIEILSKPNQGKLGVFSAPQNFNRGFYKLEIRFYHQDGDPFLDFQWGSNPGNQRPVSSTWLIPRQYSKRRYYLDIITRPILYMLFVLWLVYLVFYLLHGIRNSQWKTPYVFSLYLICSCIFTYPLVFNFTSHTVGDGWDAPYHIWALWIFNYLLASGSNPFMTDLLFYPLGTNLYFMAPQLLKSLVYIPFSKFLSGLIIQNSIYMLSFILSGTGMFLLAYFFTENTLSSFLAGFIFAFCPYRFAHSLGHFNLTSTEWLPFFVLYMFRFKSSLSFRDGAIAGLFLLFNSLVCFYYMVFCMIFGFIFVLYMLSSNWKLFTNTRFIHGCIGGILIFSIGFSPYIFGMGKEMLTHGNYVTFSLDWIKNYSADLAAYVIPSVFHPLWGSMVKPLHRSLHGGTNYAESVISTGYIPLLLVFVAILFHKDSRKDMYFFLFCILVFIILSLGPYLYIFGKGGFKWGTSGFRIPLPFIIIYKIPLLNATRVPSRYAIMVMMFISLLSSFGIKSIYIRLKLGSQLLKIFSITIFLIIVLEFLSIPYPVDKVQVPPVYGKLGDKPDSYTLLQIPYIAKHSLTSRQQFYQTIHHKPVLYGYLGRVPTEVLEYHPSLPILRTLLKMNEGIMPTEYQVSEDQQVASSICTFLNLKYIVLDTRYYANDENLERIKNYLFQVFPVSASYQKGFHIVIETSLNNRTPTSVTIAGDLPERNLYFLKGWKKQQLPGEEVTFIKGNTNTQLLFYLAPGNYHLQMECRTSKGLAKLELLFNQQKMGTVPIDDNWTILTPKINFPVYEKGYYTLGMVLKFTGYISNDNQSQIWVRYLKFWSR